MHILYSLAPLHDDTVIENFQCTKNTILELVSYKALLCNLGISPPHTPLSSIIQLQIQSTGEAVIYD